MYSCLSIFNYYYYYFFNMLNKHPLANMFSSNTNLKNNQVQLGFLFLHSLSTPPTLKTLGLVAAVGWRWAGQSSCHHALFVTRPTLTLLDAHNGPHRCPSCAAPFLPSPSPQTAGQTSLFSHSTFIQQSFKVNTNGCCTTLCSMVH